MKQAIGMVVLLVAMGGCGESRQNSFKRYSAQELVAMAFDPDSADNRREGITILSKRDWGLKEPYLKGYATILRTDKNATVQAVALCALAKAGDRKYVGDIVWALGAPSPTLRWDAAKALDTLPTEDAIDPLRKLAISDPSTDVRAASARALRHYRRQRVVNTLIEAMRDGDFAVRHQARLSLIDITGHKRGHYAEDWVGVQVQEPAEAPQTAPAESPR